MTRWGPLGLHPGLDGPGLGLGRARIYSNGPAQCGLQSHRAGGLWPLEPGPAQGAWPICGTGRPGRLAGRWAKRGCAAGQPTAHARSVRRSGGDLASAARATTAWRREARRRRVSARVSPRELDAGALRGTTNSTNSTATTVSGGGGVRSVPEGEAAARQNLAAPPLHGEAFFLQVNGALGPEDLGTMAREHTHDAGTRRRRPDAAAEEKCSAARD